MALRHILAFSGIVVAHQDVIKTVIQEDPKVTLLVNDKSGKEMMNADGMRQNDEAETRE